jgi:hypothetical protein
MEEIDWDFYEKIMLGNYDFLQNIKKKGIRKDIYGDNIVRCRLQLYRFFQITSGQLPIGLDEMYNAAKSLICWYDFSISSRKNWIEKNDKLICRRGDILYFESAGEGVYKVKIEYGRIERSEPVPFCWLDEYRDLANKLNLDCQEERDHYSREKTIYRRDLEGFQKHAEIMEHEQHWIKTKKVDNISIEDYYKNLQIKVKEIKKLSIEEFYRDTHVRDFIFSRVLKFGTSVKGYEESWIEDILFGRYSAEVHRAGSDFETQWWAWIFGKDEYPFQLRQELEKILNKVEDRNLRECDRNLRECD